MTDFITLNHGSGGKSAHNLIGNLFAGKFGMSKPMTDSALLPGSELFMAYTTDSYIVDPIFFPGGNIGKLAICGTVNDLAVSGAIPKYVSASFIIEEGLPLSDLERITESMAAEAETANVRIVTGDTKVVDKGKCDKIFINTSGIGILHPDFYHMSFAKHVKPGDKLLVNGNLADHTIAVLGARKNLHFSTPVISDCASLNLLIKEVLDSGLKIKFMRDITRGGLATVLNELAEIIDMGISLIEELIPVTESVKGICEVLGFDPLYMANEGKVLFVVDENDAGEVLKILNADPLGINSRIIGEVCNNSKDRVVVLNTLVGGKRILPMLSGIQLPRIC